MVIKSQSFVKTFSVFAGVCLVLRSNAQEFNEIDPFGAENYYSESNGAQRWTNDAFEGDICNVNKFPVEGDEPSIFYMCKTPTVNESEWPWKTIGVWTKMQCKYGKWYSPESRMCRHVSSVRRMQQTFCANYPSQCQPIQPMPLPITPQSSCAQPPCQPTCQPEQPQCPKPVVPRPCPQASSSGCGGASSNCGQLCSWMLESLKPSGTGYKQCVPKLTGEKMQYCGNWVERPCPSGTRFNPQLQVCVHDPRGGGCARPQIPIGPCNVKHQCPGQSICQPQSNVCCQNSRFM